MHLQMLVESGYGTIIVYHLNKIFAPFALLPRPRPLVSSLSSTIWCSYLRVLPNAGKRLTKKNSL